MRRRGGRLSPRGSRLSIVPVVAALAALLGLARAQAPAPTPAPTVPTTAGPTDELIVAVYLPGLYFPQLSARVELAQELAGHLGQALGRRATARVYATAEALEGDSARLGMALVEAPYAASRLHLLTPLCVATAGGHEETRMQVLAGGPVKAPEDLPKHRLAYTALAFEESAFLGNFVFEGDLQLGRDHLEPARDASSALSKVSLRKAEAVLLYEDDAAQAARAGLKPIFDTAPLPRPTLVVFDKNQDSPQVQRLREAMARFVGKVHPQLRSFKPAIADRYLSLRWQMQRRSPRLPPLLELPTLQGPPSAQAGPGPHPAQGPRPGEAQRDELPHPTATTSLSGLPAPPLRLYLPEPAAQPRPMP